MLALERRNLILEKLQEEKRVVVSELSQLYNVSEETIRRDLDKLEKEGLAKKSYGGAVINEDVSIDLPFNIRKNQNVGGKQKMAELVAGMIDDGEHIFLDASSTAVFVAKALKTKERLTVITNSMEIIREIASVQGWNVLCTGGALRTSAPSFAGFQAESMVRSYHVDKAILSCGSLDLRAGFTDRHEDTALVKRAMMSAARQVILAADHGKFDRIAFARIGELGQLSTIVTDRDPGERWRDVLGKLGVELVFEQRED